MACNISPLLPLQAIAHYEQAGDYYKGEESIRWLSLAFLMRCSSPCHTVVKIWTMNSVSFFSFQLSKQVPSESSHLRSTVGAVPESHRDLWTGVRMLTSKHGISCFYGLNSPVHWRVSACDCRLEPTPWTALFSNTVPRITSSRQHSVTSVSTCWTQK